MDADKLKAAIAKLTGSTVAAKLRQVMPEIDEKVEQGVQHEDIVAALREGGIEVNIETFRKNLYRYRAKLRAAGGQRPQGEPAKSADGNLPTRRPAGTTAEPQEETDEVPPAAPVASSFEDALDKRKRDQLGETYLNRRKPIIGKKKE